MVAVKVLRRSGPGGHLRGWCRLYVWGRASENACHCSFPALNGVERVTAWCEDCKGTGIILVRPQWATIPRGWCGVHDDCHRHDHRWRANHRRESTEWGLDWVPRSRVFVWRGEPKKAEVVTPDFRPQLQHLRGRWHAKTTMGTDLCKTGSLKVTTDPTVVDCKRCRAHPAWVEAWGRDPKLELVDPHE